MPDAPKRDRKKTALRLLFVVAAVIFVLCVITFPWAIASVIDDVIHPPSEKNLPFTPADIQPSASYTQLHIDVIGLDEINREATLRVNGFHVCDKDCGTYTDRAIFYQVDENDAQQDSLPASASIVLPSNAAEVTTKITLPVRGNLLTYPFDEYKLGLGVVIERTGADKSVKILTPDQTKGQLIMTVSEHIPRVDLGNLKPVDPKSVKPKRAPFDYAYVQILNFNRPPYLKVVVMIVALLSVFVTIFTMTTRPFDQLVLNAGALVFGIWGIRSLVLGNYPAEATLLDSLLTTVVLFMLLTLAFRGMNHFHRTGGLRLLPWVGEEKQPDPTRKCPECLSKVPAAATRCAFCGTELPPEKPPLDATIKIDKPLIIPN
jgi:hypothetical protein